MNVISKGSKESRIDSPAKVEELYSFSPDFFHRVLAGIGGMTVAFPGFRPGIE